MTRWLIFPMAGQSARFSRAGFTVPKYMLEAHGKSLFRHAVEVGKRVRTETEIGAYAVSV